MIDLKNLYVTDFTIHDYSLDENDPIDSFNIDVVLNDKFYLQLGTDGEWSFPRAHVIDIKDSSAASIQEWLWENVDPDKVVSILQLPESIFDWYEYKV